MYPSFEFHTNTYTYLLFNQVINLSLILAFVAQYSVLHRNYLTT